MGDTGTKGIILLVESNPESESGITLKEAGYLVCGVSTATKAVAALEQKFRTAKPCAIVVDRDLSEGGGFQALRRLTQSFGDKKIPFFMMGVAPTQEDLVECISAGAKGIIAKPLKIDAFEAKLEDARMRELRTEIGTILFNNGHS